MKKIPINLFNTLTLGQPWDKPSRQYRVSLANIKAGSFSLVCPINPGEVVKTSICPVFMPYLQQLNEVIPFTKLETTKRLGLGQHVYEIQAAILPKMEEIADTEVFYKFLSQLEGITKKPDVCIALLTACLTENDSTWEATVKQHLLTGVEKDQWNARFQVFFDYPQATHKSGMPTVRVVSTVNKLQEAAEAYQKFLAQNLLEQDGAIARAKQAHQRLRKAAQAFRWIARVNKAIQIGDTDEKQVKIFMQCFSAVQSVTGPGKEHLKLDLHRRNVMKMVAGKNKGYLVFTDPLFDVNLLQAVRDIDTQDCYIVD